MQGSLFVDGLTSQPVVLPTSHLLYQPTNSLVMNKTKFTLHHTRRECMTKILKACRNPSKPLAYVPLPQDWSFHYGLRISSVLAPFRPLTKTQRKPGGICPHILYLGNLGQPVAVYELIGIFVYTLPSFMLFSTPHNGALKHWQNLGCLSLGIQGLLAFGGGSNAMEF